MTTIQFFKHNSHRLWQWFSNCGPRTSSISINISWGLVTDAVPWAPPQIYLIRNFGGEAQPSVLWQVFQVILMPLKFESYCATEVSCSWMEITGTDGTLYWIQLKMSQHVQCAIILCTTQKERKRWQLNSDVLSVIKSSPFTEMFK